MLTACAAKAPKHFVRVDGKRTQNAINLEKNLIAFRDATSALKGLAWVEFTFGEEERKTDAALAIERPSSIRVDAMDSLADVWASAGSNGEKLWLYIPGKNKLYEGRATRRVLHKLAKFDWDPGELVAIVAGSPPLGDKLEVLEVGESHDAHFVLQGSGLHIWIDRKNGRVLKCVRYSDDGRVEDYSISFSDYKKNGEVDFPLKIEALFPGRGARIMIEYRDIELGKSVDTSAFRPPDLHGGKSERISNE